MRAIWSGVLSFGLVSIPVEIYNATSDKSVSLSLACPKCEGDIGMKRMCKSCGEDLPDFNAAKRSYKVSKNHKVILSTEEIESAKPMSSRSIDISYFVPKENIEPVFYDSFYYLAPSSGGEKAFHLLKEVMESNGKLAVAKITMREKERIAAIFPYKTALAMVTLHYPDEVKLPGSLDVAPAVVSEEELKLAKELVEKLGDKPFNLADFKDTYRENIGSLVQAKISGQAFVIDTKVEVKKTKDLMEALKASLH